ncbi:MAG TPA: hypothetical protein G4O13_01845 [Dehalococcoidia bacterium]|nr:hypothetical protein [Dehalococcoidia bacterium]
MCNLKTFLLILLLAVVLASGCADDEGDGGGDGSPSPTAPPPVSWDIATADSAGYVGEYSSIAVDGNGKAHIAYFEYIEDEYIGTDAVPYGDLKYATNANGAWEAFTLDTGTGMTPRIFVDGNDNVHIVHTRLGASDVLSILDIRYTTNESGSWETVAVASQVVKGSDASIAVDSNGKVHISLRNEEGVGTTDEGSAGGLRYVTNASGEWTWVDVDTSVNAGNDGDIAVDSNGKVHISYLDKDAGLKYATNARGAWEYQLVDNTLHVGWNTSIAVDGNDKVHISYSDPSAILEYPGNGYLKYATNAPGTWSIEVIDDEDAGFFTGNAVDGNDAVHIAYYSWDGFTGELRYATNASGTWERETVDSEGITGLYCAIALDSAGKPHISYWEHDNKDLKYARKG